MRAISMSASEEVVQEQLDRIIARIELRVDRQCTHASALARYGDEAKRAQSELALLLISLAQLKTLRNKLLETQP